VADFAASAVRDFVEWADDERCSNCSL